MGRKRSIAAIEADWFLLRFRRPIEERLRAAIERRPCKTQHWLWLFSRLQRIGEEAFIHGGAEKGPAGSDVLQVLATKRHGSEAVTLPIPAAVPSELRTE